MSKHDDDEEIVVNNTTSGNKGVALYKTSAKMMKFEKEMTYKIDIIPFRNKEGKLQTFQVYNVHNVGPKGKYRVLCLEKDFGKDCPVCDARTKFYDGRKHAELSAKEKEEVKVLFAKDRVLCNIMWKGEHYLLDASVFKLSKPLEVKTKSYQEAEELAEFSPFSPTKGYMVTIDTQEKEKPAGAKGTYFDMIGLGFSPRKEQYEKSIVDSMVKLDTIMNELPYDKIETLMYGGSVEEEEFEDDELDSEAEEGFSKAVDKADEEDEKPAPKKEAIGVKEVSNNKPEAKAETKQVCPKSGGTFGKDFDNFKACDDCNIYSQCKKAHRLLEEEASENL